MAQISVEELFRGEGSGAKYGCGGIMGAVAKEIVEHGDRMITTCKHGLNC